MQQCVWYIESLPYTAEVINIVAIKMVMYMSCLNLMHFIHTIVAQIENASSPTKLEVGSFQEVTSVDENMQNIVAFSFSVLNSDVVNSSFDLLTNGSVNSSSNLFTSDSLNRDIIQLQWETVNTHSRGLITVMAERDGLHQGHNTSEGAVRYRFTVNTTDLGEGPLLLTLYIKLRCVQSCATNCSQRLFYDYKQYYQQRCTCTQWQYEGESETILISAKRGEAIGN